MIQLETLGVEDEDRAAALRAAPRNLLPIPGNQRS